MKINVLGWSSFLFEGADEWSAMSEIQCFEEIIGEI